MNEKKIGGQKRNQQARKIEGQPQEGITNREPQGKEEDRQTCS